MLGGGYRLRAGGLAGWFLLVMFTGAAWEPAGAQEAAASTTNPDVARLVDKMLEAKTPEERLDLAKQIIKVDSNNKAAIDIYQSSEREIEEKQKAAAKQQQEQIEEQKQQTEGKKNLEKGQRALASGNITEAKHYLDLSRQAGVPGTGALETHINSYEQSLNLKRYLRIGGVAALIGGLAGALVWFKQKKVPYLELTEGSRKGTRYRIEQEITNIGAVEEYGDKRNDVVIADRLGAISRAHCQVRMKSGKPYLVDYGSSNGTFVNGQRIPARRLVPLRNGTQIDLAHSTKIRVGFERKKG